MNWISVKDRLPEWGSFIVSLKNNAVMEMYYSDIGEKSRWFTLHGGTHLAKHNPVTHWMLLPEPPKTK